MYRVRKKINNDFLIFFIKIFIYSLGVSIFPIAFAKFTFYIKDK